MLTKQKRRILFYLSILAFLVLLFPILLYSLGYGVVGDFKILKTGGIYIKSSVSGASVNINNKTKHTSLLSYSALVKNLVPGNHTVKVEKDGFWGWEKILPVMAETVTSRNALLIPKEPRGITLGNFGNSTSSVGERGVPVRKPLYPSVKKYWQIPGSSDFLILGEDKKIYKNKDPFDALEAWDETAVEILQGEKTSFFDENFNRLIFWDKNNIDSYWIGELDKMPEWQFSEVGPPKYLHIFSTIHHIRGVAAYPAWPDYLIAAFSNGIFAIEINPAGGQNIFPLYKGKTPEIISIELNKLILKDDENFFELQIP